MNFSEFLKSFFDQGKRTLKSHELTICLGNEACDPDSFICSIVTAIHEGSVAVINMRREVFESKGDIMFLCEYYKISPDDLIFLEPPKGCVSLEERRLGTLLKSGDEEYKLRSKKINLILVDHHKPIEELDDLEIDLIIDHHVPDEHPLKCRRVYLDTALASCASVVSRFMCEYGLKQQYRTSANIRNVLSFEEFEANISKMLMIPIILDTGNFQKIGSHFDFDEFRKLQKIAGVTKTDLIEIRYSLLSSTINDDTLSSMVILQKDFKKYHNKGLSYGCSTVKYNLEKWVDRESNDGESAGVHFESVLSSFRRENGLDFLFVNIISESKRLFVCVNCSFEHILSEENGFKPMSYKGLNYYQIARSKSRKIMIPIVNEIINREHN